MPLWDDSAEIVGVSPTDCQQSVYSINPRFGLSDAGGGSRDDPIRTDSDPYPFGYWNNFSSYMNLGLKCDKKGAR
jgi:hypothetical protein